MAEIVHTRMRCRGPGGEYLVEVIVDDATREAKRFHTVAPAGSRLALIMRVGAQQTEVQRPLPPGDKTIAAPPTYFLRDSDDPLHQPWSVALVSP